ncbi:MAG: acylphosphatase [SAR324 cluster bacterium]|nr:acylphosphatase [SAR324 cluster bacterium]
MRKHLNIQVFGRVQGVAFRHYTTEEANKLGIKGFVKNQVDGSVYIEAEGEEQELKTFVAWCHQGAPAARVNKVLMDEGGGRDFSVFEVRY